MYWILISWGLICRLIEFNRKTYINFSGIWIRPYCTTHPENCFSSIWNCCIEAAKLGFAPLSIWKVRQNLVQGLTASWCQSYSRTWASSSVLSPPDHRSNLLLFTETDLQLFTVQKEQFPAAFVTSLFLFCQPEVSTDHTYSYKITHFLDSVCVQEDLLYVTAATLNKIFIWTEVHWIHNHFLDWTCKLIPLICCYIRCTTPIDMFR